MLEFQLAMLADDALSGAGLRRDRGRRQADTAWSAALAEQIAGYEAADDDYFRARAADLKDIRDRCSRADSPAGDRSRAAGRDPVRRGH